MWIEDSISPDERRLYRVKEVIASVQSKYQLIQIVHLYAHGVCLLIDGVPRVFESDEFIYHEALVHPALHLHPNPKSVLLIGDGDGGAVREILKHQQVLSLDWVEIDECVVDLSIKHLPSCPAEICQDPRLSIFYQDGALFLTTSTKKYDVIYVSVTEERINNPSAPFYSPKIIPRLKNALSDGGILVHSLCELSPSIKSNFNVLLNNHKERFPFTTYYSVGLPSFGINWGFAFAANEQIDVNQHPAHVKNLRFYDESVHHTLFLHPHYMK